LRRRVSGLAGTIETRVRFGKWPGAAPWEGIPAVQRSASEIQALWARLTLPAGTLQGGGRQ